MAIQRFIAAIECIDFDSESARCAASIRVKCEKLGLTISTPDILIAATAVAHSCTLITRDKLLTKIPELKTLLSK